MTPGGNAHLGGGDDTSFGQSKFEEEVVSKMSEWLNISPIGRNKAFFGGILLATSTLSAPATAAEQPSSRKDISWVSSEFKANSLPENLEDLIAYSKHCAAENTVKAKKNLAAIGVKTDQLPLDSYDSRPCFLASIYSAFPYSLDTANADRQKSVEISEALLDFYYAGGRRAFALSANNIVGLNQKSKDLVNAAYKAQMPRLALSAVSNSRAPILTDLIRSLTRARIQTDINKEDLASATMLKTIINDGGWPKISDWGKAGADAAWTIAQHADHDPAFQMIALQQMERLVKSKEADAANYAYLYDRVMLKISGKQRFGTQFGECVAGVRQLQPLEGSSASLDTVRAEYGLPTMADYRAIFERGAQPCKV